MSGVLNEHQLTIGMICNGGVDFIFPRQDASSTGTSRC